MNYQIVKAKLEEKEKMYRFLQLALYDGSQYVDNEINEDIIFEYNWFDAYFEDPTRDAYFIKDNDKFLGMVFVNENLKFISTGKSIAEFLILPRFRRNHIGKKVAFDIFDKYKGNWEVQPMENNPIAYAFWEKTIKDYTNNHYEKKNDGKEDVFIFHSKE